jgi:uncharacterized membrane protein
LKLLDAADFVVTVVLFAFAFQKKKKMKKKLIILKTDIIEKK